MFDITTLFLGVITYAVTELFSWINKKSTGTPFQGKASWLVVAVVSLAVGFGREFFLQGGSLANLSDWGWLVAYAGSAYALSQTYFTTAQVFLGKILQVQPDATTPTPASTTAPTGQ